MRMIRKIIKVMLVVLWMIMIFMLSNDTASVSSKKSDGLIVRSSEVLLRRSLTVGEKNKILKYLVVPVRKSTHFMLYLILGFLVINLLREYMIINTKSIILTIVICFLYACSDEIHQLFVIGRSGEIRDVIIDTFGFGTGIFSYCLIRKHNTN